MISPGHVMIIRLSSVGDIVLATPVAAAVRSLYPQARVTWVVDIDYLDLVRSNPNIDRAIGYDYLGKHCGPQGVRRLAGELKPVDLLIDLQHKVRSVMLSWYTRPVERRVWVKRRGMSSFKVLAGRKSILRGPHQIERYFSVLDVDMQKATVFKPLLVATEEQKIAARSLFVNPGGEKPLVALFPGGRHVTKRWPVAHMIRLADKVQTNGCNVAVLGSIEESTLIDTVAQGMQRPPWLIQAGGSLGLLSGLLSHCRVVVCPDSGPAHMASALGVPVVVLFGPTSVQRWAPVGSGVQILSSGASCSPCSNFGGPTCPVGTMECMRALEPDRVWQAVERALEGLDRNHA